MRLFLVLISTSAAVLALGVPRLASATATFPPQIKTDLQLGYEPCCTICHETNKGGLGTVDKAFGLSMEDMGLLPGSTATLDEALMQMQKNGVDSDGDGAPDIDELIAQTDPNTSGKAPLDVCGEQPLYGCGAHAQAQVASGTPVWEGACAIAAAAALLVTRRRGRRPAARR